MRNFHESSDEPRTSLFDTGHGPTSETSPCKAETKGIQLSRRSIAEIEAAT